MVLAPAQTVTHYAAASTAAAIHMHYEGEVVETPLSQFSGVGGLDGVVVLAPAQNLVEIFPSDTQTLAELGRVADAVVGRGWKVGVIVPSYRIGDAHGRLRGRPLHLQAWWEDGGRICFGGPEVP